MSSLRARREVLAAKQCLDVLMSTPASLPSDVVLRTYFHAKDENRPCLLERVFAEEAVLEVRNHASAISFPATTAGREAIADVLVRSFAQTYENVYSFYLQRPSGTLASFDCNWIVAMTEKTARNVRVGGGRYEWKFDAAPPNLARVLVITIADMHVLPPAAATEVYSFLARLTYPWSSPAEVKESASACTQFAPLFEHLITG